jgi:phage portal protein BeeE
VGLLSRIAAERGQVEKRSSIDQWVGEYLLPASWNQFSYGGSAYPLGGLNTSYGASKIQEVAATLPAYAAALRGCPPAFAAQMVRALVLSQARFLFRNPPWDPRSPRKTFGTQALGLLERPWANGTTGELVSRMEWHAGLAGNAYVLRQRDRLRVLRPDWVAVVHGSKMEPDDPMFALDSELLGYVYQNGGIGSGNQNKPQTLQVSDVAHWTPLPDPESPSMGMSWITPAIRDIQGDKSATEHKLKFFANGATPNLVVKGIPAATQEAFEEIVDAMEAKHSGIRNAYKTLYLTAGADASVIGSNLQEVAFKEVQGAGETRISVLSRVPAPLLGISEGLAGSSLNAGNFGMARRMFADTWVYPALEGLAHALAPIINVPQGSELWFDTVDIPLLREDGKDQADIDAVKAQAIRTMVEAGFEPKTAVATVAPDWATTLTHTGLVSKQMYEPGVKPDFTGVTPAATTTPADTGGGANNGNTQG